MSIHTTFHEENCAMEVGVFGLLFKKGNFLHGFKKMVSFEGPEASVWLPFSATAWRRSPPYSFFSLPQKAQPSLPCVKPG